ncbi:leucine-rich repeat-containing G-protein coupled receptor 5-like [Haliotis rubra]|uniref:leucine-rich repeat-containing G-protein coupled receptor 5-like n=1 Tax=Haliotis rubra TaxID=36100 RepID=UPI001EE5950A|nr:leucine-rich repeat-containing G-protein coupled receptor 5-like [Haliotis rubra]
MTKIPNGNMLRILVGPRSKMEHILIYATLFFSLFSCVYTSDISCPKRCVCRTRRVPKLGNTYFVNCKGRAFMKVPDLSSLSENALPKRLDLSRNMLMSISRSDFPSNLNVAMLFLEANDNVKLQDSALINLAGSLQFLGLQSIRLQFTSPFTFLRGLSKLQKLILNYNSQKNDGVIAPNIFKGLGLTALKDVSMYNCHIAGVGDKAFVGIESLEELDLTFNWLKEVPSAVKDLYNLKKLTLRLNNIKSISINSFKGMSSLRDLDLSDNGGLKIEEGSLAGLEKSLESLALRTCELDDVPTAGMWSLAALKILNVGYNPLVDMSSTSLKGSYCLQTLDISKTLVPLEASILEPQKNCLVSISINDRGLTEVPRDFLSNLTKLHHVSLNKNRICVLKTDSLKGIGANSYDFSDNCLYRIEDNVFDGKGRGISLALKRTNMTDVRFVLQYKEKTFQQIWLEGLDLNCDCSVFDAMWVSEPWTLEGQCLLNSESKDLKDYEFKKFLQNNCTVEEKKTETVDQVVTEIKETNGVSRFSINWVVLIMSLLFLALLAEK